MAPQQQRPPSEAGLLSIQCLEDGERWFGDNPDVAGRSFAALRHHTLALCGEAGELANIVKKVDRGTMAINDPAVRVNVAMEVADVYIYLLNIAGIMGVDLNHLYERKRMENETRFTVARVAREALREH